MYVVKILNYNYFVFLLYIMSTFDTTKSIFFPLIPNGATATSCFNGFVCKEGNVNGFPSTFFSVEFIFNYTPSMTLNTIGS